MDISTAKRFQDRFQDVAAVREYEREIYAPGQYDSFIWSLQQPWVERVARAAARETGPLRYLDFACGTGRVLSFVEPFVQQALGVDVSQAMARAARTRARRARIVVGDLLRDERLLQGHFDLITAFRYFLNADADLRLPTLQALAARLRDSRSRLVFNVHGHRGSVRHLAIRCHAAQGRHHEELSYRQILELVEGAGLRVDEAYGFGVCPRSLYPTALGGIARIADRWAARTQWLRRLSIDLVMVCRRREE